MDNDELRLREQEIKDINKQNEILEEEIKDKKYRKEENKKDIKFTLKLIPILTIVRWIFALYSNSFNVDFYTSIELLGEYLVTYAAIYGFCSIPPIFFYIKNQKKLDELKAELNENNELLLTRTNYLNELKDNTNEKENEYTNYKYKIINNSDSLIETKTSSKTRIRKRDK